MARDEFDMLPELKKYICGKEVDIKPTIIGHQEQLAQKFVNHYGDALSATNENDWIIDPFSGTDLPQLLLLVTEKFVEIMAEPTNHIFWRPSKKNTRKILQISTFGLPCTQGVRQFQSLL